jgi:NADH:ubiquinone oxidoreductase subunit 5 (subunit L)/multisubunit Na+/H+ antiporter MnhA subunit
MTLLEKSKELRDAPVPPTPRRFEWVMWVVLALLIVAGITAGILLSAESEGVAVEQVNAELAFDNYVATARIAALEHAPNQDMALGFTALRVVEEQFPGRMQMLETSALRADRALGYTIERVLGG